MTAGFEIGDQTSDDGVDDAEDGDEFVRRGGGAEGSEEGAENDLGEEKGVRESGRKGVGYVLGTAFAKGADV